MKNKKISKIIYIPKEINDNIKKSLEKMNNISFNEIINRCIFLLQEDVDFYKIINKKIIKYFDKYENIKNKESNDGL